MQLSREELIRAYRSMATIRRFEERVQEEFSKGGIPGFVHLYAGEEASAVGMCMHLGPTDYIASTHRGHGHSIAKGCDVVGMMQELFGKAGGLCGGKGGSMHIAHLTEGMFYGHQSGDAELYRGKDEVKTLRDERDCLQHFRRRVGEAALLDMAALDAVEAEVAALIDRAVETARAAAPPPESALLTDVYASY